MMPQTLSINNAAGSKPIYISCCDEDLIAVEMDAWKRGYDRAAAEGPAATSDIAAIERAGDAACDEALQVYVAMDLARFRDVFIRAWCGGYCTRLRELGVRG